ncbi:unnamed protein product [Cochlearia groenlandica]
MMKMTIMVMMMMVLIGTIRCENKHISESHDMCVKHCETLCKYKPTDKNCVRQCVFFNCGPPSLPNNIHNSK